MDSLIDRHKLKHRKKKKNLERRVWEVREGGRGTTKRCQDKQRKTGKVVDTQQADGGAYQPPGSAVMKKVGKATEGVHAMFRL